MDSTHSQNHDESALYWAAVSLIVCEGLTVADAAARLGVSAAVLQDVIDRRRAAEPAEWPDSIHYSAMHHAAF